MKWLFEHQWHKRLFVTIEMPTPSESVPAMGNKLDKIISVRYIVAVFGLFATIILLGVQLDLSIAAGAKDMVTTAKTRKKGGIFDVIKNWIPIFNNESCRSYPTMGGENGTVGFSEPLLQGPLLSSYFIGYMISQILLTFTIQKVSAKHVMASSIFTHLLCLMLMSIADRWHCSLMIVVRILEGVAGGAIFPTLHVFLANWAPRNELNRMSCLIYSGASLGMAFSLLSYGYTLILGSITLLWVVVWLYYMKNTPNEQGLIGLSERNYINSSTGISKQSSVPWSQILTSAPFLTILAAHTCFNWGWYTFLIGTTSYIEHVHDFDTKGSFVASIPFFTMWIFSLLLGKLLDALCESETITTTVARKIATFIASVVPMICLLVLCFINDHPKAGGVIIGIGITCLGGSFCGFLINHIDIAPNYAGTLMAITSAIATIPALVVPVFISAVTQEDRKKGNVLMVKLTMMDVIVVSVLMDVLRAHTWH
ncbi:Sialin, partial [Pseudolycoriella hygida]